MNLSKEKLRKWKKDGSKVSQSECYLKAHTMLILQVLLTLSYFTLNFQGIDLDLHRSPKINNLIDIRESIHDFLSNCIDPSSLDSKGFEIVDFKLLRV